MVGCFVKSLVPNLLLMRLLIKYSQFLIIVLQSGFNHFKILTSVKALMFNKLFTRLGSGYLFWIIYDPHE